MNIQLLYSIGVVLISGTIFFISMKEYLRSRKENRVGDKQFLPFDKTAQTQRQTMNYLNETSHKDKALYWSDSCLDACYFAYDTMNEIVCLRKIRPITEFTDECNMNNHKRLGETYKVPNHLIGSVLRWFYSEYIGGFKQSSAAPVSVTSIAEAFNIYFKFANSPNILNGLKEKFNKSIDYIMSSYDENTGLFGNSPSKKELSVSTTFCAYLALHDYCEKNYQKQKIQSWADGKIEKSFEAIASQKYYSGDNNKYCAFSELHSYGFENAFICSTFYALRISYCLSNLSMVVDKATPKKDDKDKLNYKNIISRSDTERILNFVIDSYHNGGFRRVPEGVSGITEKFNKANVIHTRYALLVLKILYKKYGSVTKDELSTKFPNQMHVQIAKFVNSLISDGGAKLFPEDTMMPTLYYLRLAVKVMVLLEEFRAEGIFKVTDEYKSEIDKFQKYYEPENNLFSQYISKCKLQNNTYSGLMVSG